MIELLNPAHINKEDGSKNNRRTYESDVKDKIMVRYKTLMNNIVANEPQVITKISQELKLGRAKVKDLIYRNREGE